MDGGESMVEKEWGREYVRECMAERVWEKNYGAESMVENLWGREYCRECMAERVW